MITDLMITHSSRAIRKFLRRTLIPTAWKGTSIGRPLTSLLRNSAVRTPYKHSRLFSGRPIRDCASSRELDGDEIKRQAHALKGSAANFGFRRVSDLARILEEDARTVAPARYEGLLEALEDSYAAARRHFSKLAA
jgi:hypothetical protein